MNNLIVVDSSVAIKWFVPQPNFEQARQILKRYQNGNLTLLAPDLIDAEIGNIVWKLQRFQGLSQQDAESILNQFQSINFVITPSSSLLTDAYRLAVQTQRTVYDSLYIALSLRERCQLVTADEKLINSISHLFPHVISIKNWF